MASPTPYRLAETVKVVRKPGKDHFALLIDGVEFPYLLDGLSGAAVTIKPDSAAGVTVTILGKHVVVDDQQLIHAFIPEHSHAPVDGEEESNVERGSE